MVSQNDAVGIWMQRTSEGELLCCFVGEVQCVEEAVVEIRAVNPGAELYDDAFACVLHVYDLLADGRNDVRVLEDEELVSLKTLARSRKRK